MLNDLLADPTGDLAQILLYHVVGAKALSTDLSNGQMITTLQGKDVTVTIEGSDVFINDAQVTVANIEADNGVVHVIDAVLTIPTGIFNNSVENMFRIYPNPATDMVTLELTNTERFTGGEIQIIRMDGRVITSMEILNTTREIDLSNFDNGVYFIRFSSEGNNSTERLVLKR